MGRATDLAQRHTKTAGFEPRYRLSIGGAAVSSRLFDCTATYSSDGSSDLAINADTDLEAREGEKVVLEIGYGDELWPYFGGWIEEPQTDHWGNPSTADAYGPFRELADLSFDDDTSYVNYTLGEAISDIHAKAGRLRSTYEVRGDPSYKLTGEDAVLTIGSSLADGIGSFLELAGWRSADRPGYKRLYRPTPRPRPSAHPSIIYTEADYPPNGFKAFRGKPYGSVGAYTRDDNGAFKWDPIKITVDPKVSLRKTYWLEDYQGSSSDAYNELGRLATMLSEGVYSWTLEGISANPELLLYDTIRVHTTELRDEGGRFKERYAVVYDCAIDTSVTVDVSREGMPMNLAGETAVRVASKRIAKPFSAPRGTSSVVR